MTLIQAAKRLLPSTLKRRWKLWRRAVADRGEGFCFATRKTELHSNKHWPFSLTEIQPIRPGATLENKLNNLRLGAAKIQWVIIRPNEVFSFWKLVGDPSEKNGFAKSRSIVNGKLEPESGGGLCQLSGILYLVALKAGLQILERHPHSVDIYKEAERFTPLGADATVAYGYKDLRMLNNLDQNICFQFEIAPTQLTAVMHSQRAIHPKVIAFDYSFTGMMVEVKTIADGKLFSTYQYKRNVL